MVLTLSLFGRYTCTYHHVERFVGVENIELMSLENVQNPLWSPAEEKHTNDRQQHANHLYTHVRSSPKKRQNITIKSNNAASKLENKTSVVFSAMFRQTYNHVQRIFHFQPASPHAVLDEGCCNRRREVTWSVCLSVCLLVTICWLQPSVQQKLNRTS